jgi:DNA mismatch repair protein MutS2
VEIGAKVHVESLGVTGSVVGVHAGEAEVLVGNIRLRRPFSDLEVTEKPSFKLPAGVHLNISSAEPTSNEINLLGCTVDDATSRTDKFLDEAFLAQIPQVRIVHGTGTGALRNAIADLLKNHPHVVRFEFAPQNQGGRGVTIATLRD